MARSLLLSPSLPNDPGLAAFPVRQGRCERGRESSQPFDTCGGLISNRVDATSQSNAEVDLVPLFVNVIITVKFRYALSEIVSRLCQVQATFGTQSLSLRGRPGFNRIARGFLDEGERPPSIFSLPTEQ